MVAWLLAVALDGLFIQALWLEMRFAVLMTHPGWVFQICVWHLDSWEMSEVVTGHAAPLTSLCLVDRAILSGSEDMTVRCFAPTSHTAGFERVSVSDTFSDGVSAMTGIDTRPNVVVVALADGNIKLLEVNAENRNVEYDENQKGGCQ